MGHATDEQHSSMAVREGRFLWGQQSCMRSVEDMFDMSTDFTLIAAPLPVGSMATDKATKRTLRSNDDFARLTGNTDASLAPR
jgi:hypothetical protein